MTTQEFIPRTRPNGGYCCYDGTHAAPTMPTHPCPACRTHLRALADQPPVDTDLARTLAHQLRRRDTGFLSVISAASGKGQYRAFATGSGEVRRDFTYTVGSAGVVVTSPAVAPAQNADHTEPKMTTAPKPYTRAAEALRAAESAPEQTFEDEWKKRRQREFDAEHARMAATADTNTTNRAAAASTPIPAAPKPWSLALNKETKQ
jgi:hypothetical protein